MIGSVSNSDTIYLNYKQYSVIADLHNFQFTVVHAIGFSVFTSRLLTTYFNTDTTLQVIIKASCYIFFNLLETLELK
jgi:hypothetical protein